MNAIEIGFLVSALVTAVLLLLFRFEKQRGERVIEHSRTRLDFIVLDLIHKTHIAVQVFLKRVLRQSAYFIFHSILKGILITTKAFERNIKNMMRTNKSRSKAVEKEGRSRNKLEEIALHKLAMSLTEEEKEKYKEDVLNE